MRGREDPLAGSGRPVPSAGPDGYRLPARGSALRKGRRTGPGDGRAGRLPGGLEGNGPRMGTPGATARVDERSGDRWRSGLTARNAALVVAILGIQLGFIASYLGAFHNPSPHRVPLAVVAPAGTPQEQARQAVDRLNAIPGAPLSAHLVRDEEAARDELARRRIYGAFLPTVQGPDRLFVDSAASASVSQVLIEVFGKVERAERHQLTVVDVIPAGAGDARGLSAFYLAVGWMLGGYLVATGLSISRSARPPHPPAAVVRLGAVALYAVASGILGAVVTISILGVFSGHLLALAALGALLVFATGAFAMALQAWAGVVGVGLTVVLLVVLGNPSAGGAYAWPLLPPFWRAIGPWLPPGAGTTLVRGVIYFHGRGMAGPALVLAGYAVAGTLATLAAAAMADRRQRNHPSTIQ